MEWLTTFDWFALACWLGAFVLIAAGFAGTVVPAIPGLPMIAGGAWLVGWADDFEKIGRASCRERWVGRRSPFSRCSP